MKYDPEYMKAFVNPALKSSFKCWNKTAQKKIIQSVNHIFKQSLNMEKSRIIIEDTHYYIDENIIGVLI